MTVKSRLLAAVGIGAIILALFLGLLLATGILQLEAVPLVGTRQGDSVHNQSVVLTPDDDDWTVAVAGSWIPTRHAYGAVSDFREVAISTAFPVHVVACDVELGQHVSRGEELASVEAPRLRELLSVFASASDRLDITSAELTRLRGLRGQGLATAPKMVAAEVSQLQAVRDRESAWYQLRQALVSLGQDPQRESLAQKLGSASITALAGSLSFVRAPFEGVVVLRGAMSGVTLKAGTILFSIEDVSHAYVDVGIVLDSVNQWRQGTAVVELLGQHIKLQPTATVARLDPATGLMVIRFLCDMATPTQVEGARLEVTLQAAEQPVAWVPARGVVSRDGETWCLVANENGSPMPVRVEVGKEEGKDRIPILKGVAAGQRVLTRNAYEYLYRDLNELLKFQD